MTRLIDLEDRAHVFCGEDGEYEKWNIDPDVPIINAVPIRHGKWIHPYLGWGHPFCSECEFELMIDDTPYCPKCGARMDAE